MNIKNITNYGLLAGSVGLIGGVANQADAIITHTVINGGTGISNFGISFDFDTGANQSGFTAGFDIYISYAGTGFYGIGSDNKTAGSGQADALTSGNTVDGSLNFYQFTGTSNITTSGTDYFGFELIRSGATHYGWARISKAGGSTLTLFEFAWNQTAGEAINAGQTVIPEPAHTVMFMAAGAAGLAALRKRRKDIKSA